MGFPRVRSRYWPPVLLGPAVVVRPPLTMELPLAPAGVPAPPAELLPAGFVVEVLPPVLVLLGSLAPVWAFVFVGAPVLAGANVLPVLFVPEGAAGVGAAVDNGLTRVTAGASLFAFWVFVYRTTLTKAAIIARTRTRTIVPQLAFCVLGSLLVPGLGFVIMGRSLLKDGTGRIIPRP